MTSQYRPSQRDGLPARVSGDWTREKLYYVSRYMHIFSQGMKRRWAARVYIDLLAGPGICVDDVGEFDGSPLLAVQCEEPFTRVILVERESGLCAVLEQRVGNRAIVIPDDCNRPAVIDRVRQEFDARTLGLAFVDNLGLDVPFSTLERLTRDRRIDLIITFQIGDLTRNLEDVLSGLDSDQRWTAFFGSRGWRKVAEEARRRNESPSEIATRLMEFYGHQFGTIGYRFIGHSHQLMRNSRNVALYRLLLAAKHPRAQEFFEKISRIEYDGQRRLL